jgi:hypothetical protein
LLVGVLQNLRHLPPERRQPFAEGDASLQQEGAHLVDDSGTATNQSLAHAVKSLKIKPIVGLDRHKAHVLALHRLGDSFGIEEIVFVGLHKRLITRTSLDYSLILLAKEERML